MTKLVAKSQKLKVGAGDEKDTQVTPLISKDQMQRVSNYVKSGVQSGATIAIGGEKAEREDGNFYQPTIFDNVKIDATIAQEEIFGPVTSIFDFEDEEEAISIANSTKYGLASGVFTADDQKARWTADRIQAGIIWHNDWAVD